MPLMVVYRSRDVDRTTYPKIMERTASQLPEGAASHIAGFSEDGAFCVVDVWERRDQFEAFLPTLRKALADLNIPWAEPEVYEMGGAIATPAVERYAAQFAPV